MISLILWLVLGAFCGWIASIIMKTDGQQGTIMNIVVGIIGAAIGGFLLRAIGVSGHNINEGFSVYSVIVSIFGAVMLLGAINLLRRATAR